MNTLKKIVILLLFILIQNKINAQAQNNVSAELVEVNSLNANLVKGINVEVESTNSQIYPLDPDFIIKKDSAINASDILYDPKKMDSKPE